MQHGHLVFYRMLVVARAMWAKKPIRWLFTVAFAAFLGIAAGHTVLGLSGSVAVVDGQSMRPTYESGARVYTGPIQGEPERGDIVLADDGGREYALKRIVGLPGETVQFWRGYVFINCRMLVEPYLPKYTYTFPDERAELDRFRLGPEEYFLLGDNRTCSIDSRTYGPIPRKSIKTGVPRQPGAPHAYCVNYTLPAPGKRTIRHLEEEKPAIARGIAAISSSSKE